MVLSDMDRARSAVWRAESSSEAKKRWEHRIEGPTIIMKGREAIGNSALNLLGRGEHSLVPNFVVICARSGNALTIEFDRQARSSVYSGADGRSMNIPVPSSSEG